MHDIIAQGDLFPSNCIFFVHSVHSRENVALGAIENRDSQLVLARIRIPIDGAIPDEKRVRILASGTTPCYTLYILGSNLSSKMT